MSEIRIIERGGQRDILGEGLHWSVRENALYWTDIFAPALNRLSLANGVVTRQSMPEMIGWVIERRKQPGFIAGFKSGFVELDIDPFAIRPLCNPEKNLPDNRLNDAKADGKGRIWAGSMPLAADKASGKLYRLDPDHGLHLMDDGYVVANGPAFSPDQRWLYHNDTGLGLVYRFVLDDDGRLRDREILIRFEPDWGKPDGMTVDAEGHLWIAHWGGARVSRFTPEGRLARVIALPATRITNVCFGGPQLDRMFVTSAAEGCPQEPYAGCLFEVETGIRGLAPGLFGG